MRAMQVILAAVLSGRRPRGRPLWRHQRPENQQARGQGGRARARRPPRTRSSSSTARASTAGSCGTTRRSRPTWDLLDGRRHPGQRRRHHHQGAVRRPFQAARRVPRALRCRTPRARPAATAASTSRAATRCKCWTATASTARTMIAERFTRWPRRRSTPARRRRCGRATTSSSRRPKCEDGKKTEPARITVHQNGVLIQDDVKIPVDNTRAGRGGDPCTPGPIMLQYHGNPVQFRNVWLVEE